MGADSSVPTVEDNGYGVESDEQAANRFKRSKPPAGALKHRLLVLHGHGSNNDISELQVLNLQLAKKHGVQCDFLSAQIETTARDGTIAQLSPGPFHTWFHLSGLVGTLVGQGPGVAGGSLHDSLCRIIEHLQTHGPYDGVYGFSQGAVMATLLCSETVWRGIGGLTACPFRFAILANAGGTSVVNRISIAQCGRGKGEDTTPLCKPQLPAGVPSLHLIGKRDWHRSSSQQLVSAFEPATARTYTHAHGHEIPMALLRDRELQSALTAFFAEL